MGFYWFRCCFFFVWSLDRLGFIISPFILMQMWKPNVNRYNLLSLCVCIVCVCEMKGVSIKVSCWLILLQNCIYLFERKQRSRDKGRWRDTGRQRERNGEAEREMEEERWKEGRKARVRTSEQVREREGERGNLIRWFIHQMPATQVEPESWNQAEWDVQRCCDVESRVPNEQVMRK